MDIFITGKCAAVRPAVIKNEQNYFLNSYTCMIQYTHKKRVALLPLCCVLLCFTIPHAKLAAQDITGTWEGNYGRSFLMQRPEKLVVELFLHNDSVLTGATHLYYRNKKYEHYSIKGVYRRADSAVSFSEDSVIALKLGLLETNCMGRYKTKLVVTDTTLRLEGSWKDKSRSIFRCPGSTVWLSKRLPAEGKTITRLPAITSRSTDIQSIIEIKKAEMDSIKIEVYDNGEIDNDTVSVVYNDDMVVNKQRISATPITFFITLSASAPLSKIKLVAESLGNIPPCTAYMVVTTRLKRYEVSLSSDFYKNGVVEFFLKE
jgi:hypothetical protein